MIRFKHVNIPCRQSLIGNQSDVPADSAGPAPAVDPRFPWSGRPRSVFLLGLVALAGCGADGQTSLAPRDASARTDSGGAPAVGGSSASGDPFGSGGATGSGGSPAIGGASGSGGATGTGGRSGSGGVAGSAGLAPGRGGGGVGGGGGTAGRASVTGTAGAPSAVGAQCPVKACTTCGAGGNLHNLNNDNWAGSLTLFISYSSDTRNETVDKGFTASQWNAAVNSFDVASFAAQVKATGAKNILLMLGQNTGYYCSPNSTYEGYAGVAPGTRCSTRDLPMEIADALAPLGIGMYLYLPEDVGWGDKKAANGFGLSSLAVANWVVDGSFTPKWNAVIKTWADRYGAKVKGWFFDGYEIRWGVTQAMAQTYRNTCLAANPCGIVTFNGTNSNPVSDTQRGETRINPATGLPAKGLPTSRWDKVNLQVMWDFPLQAAWGQEIADDSPAIYTNANLKNFISAAVKAQAVFALDCRTSLAGKLSTPIFNQLVAIKQ